MSKQRNARVEGPSDADLMAAVSHGSLAELGILFERHASQVHALCHRLTGDADAADDLTQETFLRVQARAPSFRGDSQFSTWLYRLAYNATIDYHRRIRTSKNAVEHMRQDLEIGKPQIPAVDDSPRAGIIEAALAALAEQERDVLVLTRYHELRYAEVAVIVGCSAATARVRAHRAIRHLRQLCLELERRDYDLRVGP